MTKKYKIRYGELSVLLLAILVTYFWSFMLDSPMILNLFWVLVITLILPILAFSRQLFGTVVSRKMLYEKNQYYVNDDVDVKIEVKNKYHIPNLFPMVLDPLPENYKIRYTEEVDQIKVFPLVFGKKSMVYTLRNVPRGPLNFENIKLIKRDLLGFVEIQKEVESKKRMLVYPRHLNLSVESVVGNELQQRGSYKKYLGRENSQITGVREYQKGDKLSLINWKVSAKKQKLMSKEFSPYLIKKSNLILDCYNKDDQITYSDEFELAVSVTASIAYSFGKSNQPFVLRMNNREGFNSEKRSNTQFLKEMMQKLALVRENGEKPISVFCKENSVFFEPETLLFIVTSNIDDNMEKIIEQLTAKKIIVKVYLIGRNSTAEKKLPYVKRIKSLNDLGYNDKNLKGVAR
ncbi:DUF58 domain-containing protein [Proteinivorax tanatarense]|uniref:DUF58 domain-containing protein n=1 Tax=Proteinivorax tanatarense TaxID=1260629 RepID=A0AAU7VKF1_9FIRM